MNIQHLTLLLYIKSKFGSITIANFEKQFPEKKYGKTLMAFLFEHFYIALDEDNERYCYVTYDGDRIIDALEGLIKLIK